MPWALVATVIVLVASLLSPPAQALGTDDPAAAELRTGAARFVTIADNDAGWVVIDGASQWIAPACRRTIEGRAGAFEVVAWSVLAGTADLTPWLPCGELIALAISSRPSGLDLETWGPAPVPADSPLADGYLGASPGAPSPNDPVPPARVSPVRLVTIPNNSAGWAIIDGAGSWVGPNCRRTLESRGARFEVVAWAVISQTSEADPIPCDRLVAAWVDGTRPERPNANPTPSADGVRLARGINLAGDFEVTPRGSWGTPIEERFFPLVAARGFDHVRIPIRWSAYTGPAPDHRIDPGFFAEVDRLVDLAGEHDLGIVIDVHFFEELDDDPWGERDRFLDIWDQIARRYRNRPASVVFELLNEPVGVFTERPEVWNRLAAEALAVVRRTNPDRTVIIGPVNWNHASRLADLRLPDDPNLVTTIHVYDPFEFTHQGAVWVDPVPPTGVTWSPGQHGLSFNWADRSWGMRRSSVRTGLRVQFDQAWAALAVAAEAPARHNELRVEADRAFDGIVLCNFDGGSPVTVDLVFAAGGNGRADLSACGEVRTLAIQAVRGGHSVVFEQIAVCSGVCQEIVVTQAEAIDQMITSAAEWATRQGSMLYIGEFGVLSPQGDPTDPAARAAWTRAVRTSAERNGAGWAYFELNSEFGAWDRNTGRWRPELVNALLG